MQKIPARSAQFVDRRTGGLERENNHVFEAEQVDRRTGGLENIVKPRHSPVHS